LLPSLFSIATAGFALGQAFPFLTDIGQTKAAAKRVYEIIDTKSAIDIFDKPGKVLPSLVGNIEFSKVVFSYPQRPDSLILKGLNLKIPGGKTVALVGSRFINIL
jgi:ATP-binding cassette subfamily B (MDR/TAP) protein 1